MNDKPILMPERLRQVPTHFSWVDHRLVRSNYLPRAEAPAWALYLTLVCVGDAQGVSYYSDRTLERLLRMGPAALEQARRELLAADVLAHRAPYYQVLNLK